MSVRVEAQGAVTTVVIERPQVRNAVDHETALALRAAFAAFEADQDAHVAVLTGAGGTFCAVYDLKRLAERGGRAPGARNRRVPAAEPARGPGLGPAPAGLRPGRGARVRGPRGPGTAQRRSRGRARRFTGRSRPGEPT